MRSTIPLIALLAVPTTFAASIDIDQIVEQAREAARYAARDARDHARDVQRQVLDMRHQLHDLDLDFARMAFVQGELGGRTEIVKNAPYSAEAVSESVQVLGDGNRIVKQTRTLIARDSLGRTRQEKKTASGRTIAYVFDPIEGRTAIVDPERGTVMRIPRAPSPPIPPVPPVPPAAPVPGAAAVPPVPPVPPVPGDAAMPGVTSNRVIVRRHGEVVHDDMRVEVLRIPRSEGGGPGAPMALTLPLAPRGKGETKALGTRDVGGVRAEGTQTTHTIAAGEIGNERPIVITSERWFSPELHVVVLAKTVDPRVGETSYRLANLKREEPAPELFKIPSDSKPRR